MRPLVLAPRQGGPARWLGERVQDHVPDYYSSGRQQPEPAPVDPDPNFPVVWEMDSLFGETPRQLTLAEAAPKKPRPKPAVTHRSPVPLANLDDWLDFAEALLGRQDIKEGTLGRTFDNLTELSEYEEEVEDRLPHGHGPGHAASANASPG